MKSIGLKITAAIIGCSILIALLVGGIAINRGASIITKEAEDKLTEMAKSDSAELDREFMEVQYTAEGIESAMIGLIDLNRTKDTNYMTSYNESLKSIIKAAAGGREGIFNIYAIINPDLAGKVYTADYIDKERNGKFVFQDVYTMDDFKESNVDMDWYYNAVELKKGVWSDPYVDNKSGVETVSYTMPIYSNNTLIGVVGIDIAFEDFKKSIFDIKAYNTGYAFLLNEEYDYIVHKTLTQKDNLKEIDKGKYKAIVDKMEKDKSGAVDAIFGGQKKLMSYSRLINGNILVITVPRVEVLKGVYSMLYIMIGVVVLGCIIAFVIASIIGRNISGRIAIATNYVANISKLDLKTGLNEKEKEIILKSKDETGIMGRAVMELEKELKNIVKEIKTNSEEVTNSSAGLSNSTKDTVSSIEAISTTVEELAKGATEQAKDVQDGVARLDNLAEKIADAANSASIVKEYSDGAMEANRNGLTSINELVEKFKANNDAANRVGQSVNNLSEKSGSISNIITTIQSVAEETNLLALNAAIEAARAGEAGRGFSVVAEEIRKLSEETTQSTKQIESIVMDIQKEITSCKKNVDIGKEASEIANGAANDVTNNFDVIKQSIENTITHIDNLILNVKTVDDDKNTVMSAMEGVSAISEESAAATEEVSASVQEQYAAMETISQAVESMKTITENLQDIVNMFEI